MKARCEQCDCVPHAPRRRCPDCGKLVCVSNCWNRRSTRCKSCSDSIGFSGSACSCREPTPIESEQSRRQREIGERIILERSAQRVAPEQYARAEAERLRLAGIKKNALVLENRTKAKNLREKWAKI